jgi:hypothetical protein
MGLIGTLTQAVSGAVVSSSDYNSNINTIQTTFDTYAVLTDVAKTITVQHTFNPSSANPPFILGANAIDQLVTGLNAEKVNGIQPVRGMMAMVIHADVAVDATGDGFAYLLVPAGYNGLVLSGVRLAVADAGSVGTTSVQIHNVTAAVDMLSTVVSIDTAETSSDTAATPPVIDTANDDVATNDLLRVDIDSVHSSVPADGLFLQLEFSAP